MISIIEASNLDDAVRKLKKFKMTNCIIEISNVNETYFDVTRFSDFDFLSYFLDKKCIDGKWKKNKDWYLSYSRRLLRKIKNKSIIDCLCDILTNDKNSRRCIVSTFVDDDFINETYPALSLVQFTIEKNKLIMTTYWRSQEGNYAFPINTLCMFSYQRLLFAKLIKKYPDLELGKYISYINNIHFEELEHLEESKKNKILKFYCSIIEKKGEIEYDKNYK